MIKACVPGPPPIFKCFWVVKGPKQLRGGKEGGGAFYGEIFSTTGAVTVKNSVYPYFAVHHKI